MNFSSTVFPAIDDDFIGNESCIDLQSENDVFNIEHQNALAPSEDKRITRCIRNKDKKREFPPPIPCLAQTENLASHMRYVLTRYYTNEGRLIIKEEKVKHHEYFHAHRENGRLTLQLVPLDNDDDYFMGTNEEEEEQEVEEEQKEELASLSASPQEINNVTIDQSVVINDGFEENKDNTQKSVGDEVVVENENEIVGGANRSGNYLNCNSMMSASSGIFEALPLRHLRIVHG
ncbi:protein FANTASTIC FOUR 1-like [Trifolium pratense]|uniref:Protein FANTASTIC FOUR 1-like n=1 Tax=Trifolium pratense TaxID=57577 RepID=A0A2K3NV98_TRIPR|nr:protein FANTASTIC FOUR 1-like [Trifolium pratense]